VNITERKRLRREIRSTLGTSRDDAPDTAQLLRAAKDLDRALELTSTRFSLQVFDRKTGASVPVGTALSEQVEAARRARADRNARLNAMHTGTYKAGE
jgi:hypothetical protein